MMRRRIAHVALLLALPALGLPAPAQAQRWDGLEDAGDSNLGKNAASSSHEIKCSANSGASTGQKHSGRGPDASNEAIASRGFAFSSVAT